MIFLQKKGFLWTNFRHVQKDSLLRPLRFYRLFCLSLKVPFYSKENNVNVITGNDRYSGHGYSGIDRFRGTKTPDDAILFTVSGITAIVEQNF